MSLVKSSEGKRQTVHDLSLPRCPHHQWHMPPKPEERLRQELWPGCKSASTMGNAPIITMCDLPPGGQKAGPPWLGFTSPEFAPLFNSTAWIQITWIAVVRIQITWSAFIWIQFTQDPIARHNSEWQYRMMHCWTFSPGVRVSIQNRGWIDGLGSGKLVNTGSEEVTLKKHNNMSSTQS